MKFTVECKRTVRVREYETLTFGFMTESDTAFDDVMETFDMVENVVDQRIEWKLEELKKAET